MRILLAALSIATILAPTGAAFAHQDYAGDVHPRVTVENGQFVISFHNNRDERSYRLVLSPTGKVVSPRRAIAKIAGSGDAIRRELDGRTYRFPAWKRLHHGKPFYLLGEDTAARRVELPWGSHTVEIVHDALVTARDVVILATPDLQLFRFARAGGAPAALRLGKPYKIYDFPRASNLAAHGESFLVAWIDTSQRLLLSSWAPATGRSKTVVLEARADWNTTLAIGVIRDVLLLARHVLGLKGAVIQTTLRALPLR
jgi:hypothetical protein